MGSFMMAVVSNDLHEACSRADDVNRYNLWDIVGWFYNEAPSDAWGSPAKVNAWLAKKVKEREQRQATQKEEQSNGKASS